MGEDQAYSSEVRRVARMLARAAGQVWDELNNHPGYFRTCWCQEALTLLGVPDVPDGAEMPRDRPHDLLHSNEGI